MMQTNNNRVPLSLDPYPNNYLLSGSSSSSPPTDTDFHCPQAERCPRLNAWAQRYFTNLQTASPRSANLALGWFVASVITVIATARISLRHSSIPAAVIGTLFLICVCIPQLLKAVSVSQRVTEETGKLGSHTAQLMHDICSALSIQNFSSVLPQGSIAPTFNPKDLSSEVDFESIVSRDFEPTQELLVSIVGFTESLRLVHGWGPLQTTWQGIISDPDFRDLEGAADLCSILDPMSKLPVQEAIQELETFVVYISNYLAYPTDAARGVCRNRLVVLLRALHNLQIAKGEIDKNVVLLGNQQRYSLKSSL